MRISYIYRLSQLLVQEPERHYGNRILHSAQVLEDMLSQCDYIIIMLLKQVSCFISNSTQFGAILMQRCLSTFHATLFDIVHSQCQVLGGIANTTQNYEQRVLSLSVRNKSSLAQCITLCLGSIVNTIRKGSRQQIDRRFVDRSLQTGDTQVDAHEHIGEKKIR